MLVQVKTPVAVSPTNGFGEIFTIVDNDDNAANGLNTNSQTARGGVGMLGRPVLVRKNTVGGDFNPERIQIDDSGLPGRVASPQVSVGAKLERRHRRHELRLRQLRGPRRPRPTP